jgi:hypothetical protein
MIDLMEGIVRFSLFVCLLLLFRLLLLSSSRVCSCLKLGATKKRRKGREQNHEQMMNMPKWSLMTFHYILYV